jgi:hypothetical protein
MLDVLAALSLLLASAHADTLPDYLDDRSSVAALVRSYYNAISREEYARAWNYFGEDRPVADYGAFRAGYQGTREIDLRLGEIATEGAAGNIYETVPVAIAATREDGTAEVFASCYTAHLSQPPVQEPPFMPMRLVKAELHPVSDPLETARALRLERNPGIGWLQSWPVPLMAAGPHRQGRKAAPPAAQNIRVFPHVNSACRRAALA